MSAGAKPLAQAMRQIRAFAGERVDDSELLKRFQQSRDEAAFAEIVRRHGPLVLGVARRWLADRDEADDVVQSTFLALSRQAKRLDVRQSLSGWLYTVAFRLARKAQKRASRRDQFVVSRNTSHDPLAEITGRE